MYGVLRVLKYHSLPTYTSYMSDELLDRPNVSLVVLFVVQGAASGVRVNSVSPGHVETPIYGDMPVEMLTAISKTTQLIGRPIQPDEVRYTNRVTKFVRDDSRTMPVWVVVLQTRYLACLGAWLDCVRNGSHAHYTLLPGWVVSCSAIYQVYLSVWPDCV